MSASVHKLRPDADETWDFDEFAPDGKQWRNPAGGPWVHLPQSVLWEEESVTDEPPPRPKAASGAAARPGGAARPAGAQKPLPPIIATPYVWRDPTTLPRRQWLYGRHLSRKYISATVAPSGVGKSSLSTAEAICLATGKELLGVQCHSPRPLRVWMINLEDPLDELEKKVAAVCLHHNVDGESINGLFLDSGRQQPVCVATQTRDGTQIIQPVVAQLEAEIRQRAIDVVIIDPFVSAHQVSENDNNAIDVVAKLFNGIADRTNCAIELVHHTRKASGQAGYTVDDARGAGALLAVTRSARVLNPMTREEGKKAARVGDDFLDYFRVDAGKSSMSRRSGTSVWYHMASQSLGNAGKGIFDFADDVGVVEAWRWPAPPADEDVVLNIAAVQGLIGDGEWREDVQTKTKWVGCCIAEAHGLDWRDKENQARIKVWLAAWIEDGSLKRVVRKDSKRMTRTFIEVGRHAMPTVADCLAGVARRAAQEGRETPHPEFATP